MLLAAVLGLAAAGALRAADAAPLAQIEVFFDHPENFTDVKDRADPTDAGRDAILEALRGYIIGEAGKYLPAAFQLTIVFTDIDLAGDFESWRGAQYDTVRIIKPIYPPAFKFTYKVKDSTGRVFKEGKESIRDLNFEMRETLDTSDPLRIEKNILREWLRNNLQGIK
jgi:hypothetical protein